MEKTKESQGTKRKRLGEMLVEEGLVTSEQVEAALVTVCQNTTNCEQRRSYDFLGRILLRFGFIDDTALQMCLRKQHLMNYGKGE